MSLFKIAKIYLYTGNKGDVIALEKLHSPKSNACQSSFMNVGCGCRVMDMHRVRVYTTRYDATAQDHAVHLRDNRHMYETAVQNYSAQIASRKSERSKKDSLGGC